MAAGTMTALKIAGGCTPGKNIAIIGYGGANEIVNDVKAARGRHHQLHHPAGDHQPGVPELAPELRSRLGPGGQPGVSETAGHVRLVSIGKRYSGTKVLDDVSVEVAGAPSRTTGRTSSAGS
jgi:hypothetical protein